MEILLLNLNIFKYYFVQNILGKFTRFESNSVRKCLLFNVADQREISNPCFQTESRTLVVMYFKHQLELR